MLNSIWYKYTTSINPYGDLSMWNEQTNDKMIRCKGLVRREDGLVFRNTVECRPCLEQDSLVTRAQRNGDFLEGQDIFGTKYSQENGRILPSISEIHDLHKYSH